MSVKVDVFQANQSFYDAFNKQNLEAMHDLWLAGNEPICIHPGWPVIQGHDKIIDSWGGIFENTDHLEIKLSNTEVMVSGEMAWVSCQENLFSIHEQGVQSSAVHATNIFRKENGSWKIALHHAAGLPPKEEG